MICKKQLLLIKSESNNLAKQQFFTSRCEAIREYLVFCSKLDWHTVFRKGKLKKKWTLNTLIVLLER